MNEALKPCKSCGSVAPKWRYYRDLHNGADTKTLFVTIACEHCMQSDKAYKIGVGKTSQEAVDDWNKRNG